MVSIATSLGTGSGIDTQQLVKDLAAAAKAPKAALIARKEAANTARVSALGAASSGIETFATSLNELLSGGTLYTQPTSSNAGAVSVSALAGSRLAGLSASIQVNRLATAQSLMSAPVARDATFGGALSMKVGGAAAFDVDIPAGDRSLAGIARAISGSGRGVTASVVTQGTTARLVVKGASGTASAFTMTGTGDLAQFGFPATGEADGAAGMTATQAAQDAEVVIDGVATTRATNSITDLVDGVKIDLKTVTTSAVAIGAEPPTAAIRTAVQDFANAYNELKTTLDALTTSGSGGSGVGALRSDTGVREMQRQLGRLTATVLASGTGPRTLAEIGMRTARDGSLSVDTAVLDRMLAQDPDGVEALFNPAQRSSDPLLTITSAMGRTKPGTYQITDIVTGTPPSAKINGVQAVSIGGVLSASGVTSAAGLSFTVKAGVTSATIIVDSGLGGALQTIRDQLKATNGPLFNSYSSASAEAKELAKSRTAMESRDALYTKQLSTSFTKMDSRVGALKATQAYLKQQIAVWTNDD
ncbi:flagellar filament capping protein FliD [Sphingomonas montana]|uniref:flagellar filament capping protein FliD n=1 Tax=Sphingomonas montana TaxID=1843236 RepID=UPI00096DCF35|nr:flagellar filament capping protein FliD [Sphingomonas montana]